MARRSTRQQPSRRPTITVQFGAKPNSGARKGKRKARGNVRALARRAGRWAAVSAGSAIGAGATRAAASTGRIASRATARGAELRENRRLHGRRTVVRDLTAGPEPLSLAQAQARLLGLETAQARQAGRPDPAFAQVVRPLQPSLLRAAAAPVRLSRRDLRRLPKGWDAEQVHATQAAITEHLTSQITPRPAAPVDTPTSEPTPLRPVPTPGTATRPTRGTPAVIEPSNFEDLKNPAIEQATWTTELPAHAQAVVALLAHADESMQGLAAYHATAGARSDIVQAYEEAAGAMQTALDQCRQAAQRAEDWANSVELPDFSKAG